MKRALVAGILGVAAASTAFGQGHVLVSNYLVSPYSQVVWDASIPDVGGTAVMDTSVRLTIWYALGSSPDEGSLMEGPTFTINPGLTYDPGEGFGPGGYFDAQSVVVSDWASGVVSLQLRASGFSDVVGDEITGQTAIWSTSQFVSTALPANTANEFSPGLTVSIVPEPSTFALAGLGIASLFLLRRKKA